MSTVVQYRSIASKMDTRLRYSIKICYKNLRFLCTPQKYAKTVLLPALLLVLLCSISVIQNLDRMDFESDHYIAESQKAVLEVVQRKMVNSPLNDTFSVINPHPFKYINNPSNCTFQENGKRRVLVIVKSTVKNIRLRSAVRKTWGDIEDGNVRIVFMLGYNNTRLQKLIDKEASTYRDIVQEDFKDAYLNNTLKTVMSFNWATEFCSTAQILLFVDDDFIMNLPKILAHIYSIPSRDVPLLFEGFLLKKPVDRLTTSKWFVSLDAYPFKFWPPYLAGGAYLASMQVAKKFRSAFPFIKYLGVDDAWLGIVATKVGVRPTDHIYFHNFGKYSHLAMVHQCCHTEKEMLATWWQYQHNNSFHFGTL